MPIETYRNFDVRVRRESPRSRQYCVEVEDGLVSGRFKHPYSKEGLDNIGLRATRSARTRLAGADLRYDEAQEIGRKLFTCLLSGKVLDLWNRNRDKAEKEERGLRLRLQCDTAPELLDLPWEYLWDQDAQNHLATSASTPVLRCLPIAGAVAPLPVVHPLRVLVVVSSPRGLERLNTKREWDKLEEIWQGSAEAGAVELKLLTKPTFQTVLDEVEQASVIKHPYHIFHFIGHGQFNPETNEGELLFEDRHKPAPVSARRIAELLRGYPQVRLAVFNACEAGRANRKDPFAGVVQRVVQQGLPAAIGMQFPIPDRAAITFSRAFYKSLAAGRPVEAALSMARKQMSAEDGMEWAIPVIYVRPKTDLIFRFSGPPSPPKPSQPAAIPLHQIHVAPTKTAAGAQPGSGTNPAEIAAVDRYAPRGPLDPSSRFYVKRREEDALVRQIRMKGVSLVISAPGLTGKSSLLRRLEVEAKDAKKTTASLDLATFPSECFADAAVFLRQFMLEIAGRLPVRVDRKVIEDTWANSGTNNLTRCSRWMRQFLDDEPNLRFTLLLDGVDSLLSLQYRKDFVNLLTYWHNERRPAGESPWNRLDLVLATSEEPLRWGLSVFFPITLGAFTEEEVSSLNRERGHPLKPALLKSLWAIVAGHPYLVHQCLYAVAERLATPAEALSPDCDPFAPHLADLEERIRVALLEPALKEILSAARCTDDRSFYHLRSLGLIRRERRPLIRFSCPLYEDYFKRVCGV